MGNHTLARAALLGLIGMAASANAQSDLYKPYKNKNLWSADTLFLGAGFTRLSNDPVSIWLVGNEAGLDGELSYVDPVTGAATKLFRNHDTPNQPIILSDKVNIPIGATLTFMYRVVGKGTWTFDPTPETMLPKYTGPNHARDKLYSNASSDANEKPDLRFGHRWSVAGRVNDSILEFGFEDDTSPTSDMDFDDIVFDVKGLKLAVFHKSAKTRNYLW
jgi:hypothetical protein